MGLALSVTPKNKVIIHGLVTVEMIEVIHSNQVQIHFDAPKEVRIERHERQCRYPKGECNCSAKEREAKRGA